MEITLYLDLYPGQTDFRYLNAYSTPGEKYKENTRYAITFNIPNPYKPDITVLTNVMEVIE